MLYGHIFGNCGWSRERGDCSGFFVQWSRGVLAVWVLLLMAWSPGSQAQTAVTPVGPTVAALPGAEPIRFGILPLGGAAESRNDWMPLLLTLGQAVQRPVSVLSVTSYEALEHSIEQNQVDMAFLSGKMALDTVTRNQMKVIAQVTRHDGLPGYRALLLMRKSGPLNRLDDMLAVPGRWRLARGGPLSLSGFMVPKLQIFLPNRIAMETSFSAEIVGTHQTTALAVANGEADVATNNTADFERFRLQFPSEAARLQVVWASDLIPHAQLLVRRDASPELVQRLQTFLVGYGQVQGPKGEAERTVLKSLHNFAAFVAADNRSLLPTARLAWQLARQSALEGQWVSEAARQGRLDTLDAMFKTQQAVLRGDPAKP